MGEISPVAVDAAGRLAWASGEPDPYPEDVTAAGAAIVGASSEWKSDRNEVLAERLQVSPTGFAHSALLTRVYWLLPAYATLGFGAQGKWRLKSAGSA
jgi:hypothetical protein